MRILNPKGYLFICEPGRYKSFIIMEYITKILSFFSKFFKSYKSILDEEKIIVRYFIKNQYKVIDRLRKKKIKDDKEEYFMYKPRFLKHDKIKKEKKITKDNPFEKLSELRFR